MRPLTWFLPKPLVPVAGAPMVVRQMAALKRAGITEVVINAAHLAPALIGRLGDGSRFGMKILWSVEGLSAADALETRGGIRRALPLLTSGGEEHFLVIAGDIATDYDYRRLVERASAMKRHPQDALAHLVLVPNPNFHPKGDMALGAGGRISRDGEKKTFSSLGLYSARLFEGVPEGPSKLFPWLFRFADRGLLTGEVFEGRWANVGTPAEWMRAEDLFA